MKSLFFFSALFFPVFIFSQEIPVVDGFDYPIDNRGYDDLGDKVSLIENINPETNFIFPHYPIANPSRGNNGSNWHNVQDIGNFLPSYGIHPGEDWNYNYGCSDSGKEVKAIANGIVFLIRPSSSLFNENSLGWSIVIEHLLPDGNIVFSEYTHVTTANNVNGELCHLESDFTVSEGMEVEKGDVIARIVRGTLRDSNGAVTSNCGGDNISGVPPHLHFSLLDNNWDRNSIHGYYGSENSSSFEIVNEAYNDMEADGFFHDPSDFIDAHRTLVPNDGEKICLGGPSNYYDVDLYLNFSEEMNINLSNLRVNGQFVSHEPLTYTNGRYRCKIPAQEIAALNLPPNYYWGISFTVSGTFEGEEFEENFYEPKATYTIQPDYSGINQLSYQYEKEATYKLGLFKGIPLDVNGEIFEFGNLNWEATINRAEASKILVLLGIKTGHLQGINIDNPEWYYPDINNSDWFYPYVQTLINAGVYTRAVDYPGVYGFLPYEGVTYSEFAKWCVNLFNLQQNSCSNCTPYSVEECDTNLNILKSLRFLHKITNDYSVLKNVFDDGVFDSHRSNYESLCNEFISRNKVAEIAVSLYAFLNPSSENQNRFTTQNYEWNTIGGILSPFTSGDSDLDVTYETTIDLMDNQYWQSIVGELETSNGNPVNYYWAVQGGTLESLQQFHNQVRFTPPTVNEPTVFRLYIMVYANDGSYSDGIINFNVTPSENETNDDFYIIDDYSISPTTLQAGESIDVALEVCYTGDNPASDFTENYIIYYMSEDDILNDEDGNGFDFHDVDIGSDSPCQTINQTVTVDSDLEPGEYTLFILVDPADSYSESSESNNIISIPITVTNGQGSDDEDLYFTYANETNGVDQVASMEYLYFDYEVCYDGELSSSQLGEVNIDFYLSENDIYEESQDINVGGGYFDLSSNNPCNDELEHRSIKFPLNISEGYQNILLVIDSNNQIPENDESNNVYVIPIEVVNQSEREHDFDVINGWLSNNNVQSGETIELSVNQCYTGLVTDDYLASSSVGYYLSPTPFYNPETAIFLGEDNSSLGSDVNCNSESEFVTIPSVETGNYYIIFYADNENEFIEENEDNNFEVLPIYIEGVDLVNLTVDYINILTPALSSGIHYITDDQIQIEYSITNNSNIDLNEEYRVYFFLIRQDSFDIEQISGTLDNIGFGFLPAGETLEGTRTFNLSYFPVNSQYRIAAFVDFPENILESDENDNVLTSSDFIIARPDWATMSLYVEGEQETIFQAGQEISLHAIIENLGEGFGLTLEHAFYLSEDNDLTNDEVIHDYFENIGSGQSNDYGFNLIIPENLLPGTYYFGHKAEYLNYIHENDELNNIILFQFTIAEVDETPPQVNFQDVTVSLDQNGIATVNVEDFDNGTTDDVTAFENLVFSPAEFVFNCDNIGTVTRHVTVTDEAGNSISGNFQVNVVDDISPELYTETINYTVIFNSDCEAIMPDLSQLFSVTDNCTASPIILQNPSAGSLIYDNVNVIIKAVDESGNESENVGINLLLEDSENPVITSCPSDFTVSISNNNYQLPDFTSQLNVSDCTNVEITQSPESGTELDIGEHTITLIAVDENSNVSICNFIIKVETTLGTNDILLDDSVIIYPNPFDSSFIVRVNQGSMRTIEVYDMSGKVLRKFDKVLDDDFEIDMSAYKSGEFVVSIILDDGSVISRKIIKE